MTVQIRLKTLLDTCTYVVFNYTRRGLFDRDKLIVLTLLAFHIMLKVSTAAQNWKSMYSHGLFCTPDSLTSLECTYQLHCTLMITVRWQVPDARPEATD